MSQYSENHYYMSMYADICLDFLASVSAYACTLFTTDILIKQLTRRNKKLLVLYRDRASSELS